MAALAIVVASLVIATCGGGEGSDGGNATAARTGNDIVSIDNVDGTDVLVDSEGRSLYTADVEKDRIRCTGACISIWDPVGASANDAQSASARLGVDLGVVNRPDGDRQLTFNELPLYSFTEEGPGQLDGDGFVDDFDGTRFEWAAATTGAGSGAASSGSPSGGSPY
jgi:predicted lipoprotein with Yx(FWY)xxD motif